MPAPDRRRGQAAGLQSPWRSSLDSRVRGNDARPQALAVYVCICMQWTSRQARAITTCGRCSRRHSSSPPSTPSHRSRPRTPYSQSQTACTITMRPSSRLRRPGGDSMPARRPSPAIWMVWVWTAVSAPLRLSAVTSSQARARKPAASSSARISADIRRKLVAASRAHITGKIGGCTGPAIGSWSASNPPGRSTR